MKDINVIINIYWKRNADIRIKGLGESYDSVWNPTDLNDVHHSVESTKKHFNNCKLQETKPYKLCGRYGNFC